MSLRPSASFALVLTTLLVGAASLRGADNEQA
ncbi:MAG: hypothetical protein RLZ85_808, partial [Verrucomicrobiota bacterium]